MANAQRLIRELSARGCRFALDEFGSGLSSFTYLKHLPVDYLKIDGSFVQDMLNDPMDAAMVRAIAEVGRALGLQTIAEFVENEATIAELRRADVDCAQGYGIQRPFALQRLMDYRPHALGE
jgi:EAL domain-containing protein (putative c-di-GMP-specific phosphodiesterase class I)